MRNHSLISRRHLIGGGILVLSTPSLASALTKLVQTSLLPDDVPDLISPPDNRADWPAWRQSLKDWRKAQHWGYDDPLYHLSETQWSQTCFCCHKIMTWDESFLDPATGHYKVEEYLENGKKMFGGFDAVVLWQAYPRIGFDDRNQFDYYRGLPGGLKGLADVVKRFHKHGVRVFIDYNPWDTGTRREPTSDEEAIAELVKAIDADGVFLDTMTKGASSMRVALDAKKKGVAFETELPLALEGVPYNQLSWAQWLDKTEIPGVLRDHWFERRHMMHAIRRWDTDHTNEIHMAWMNGTGVLVWENVFGSWNRWSEENCLLTRQMLPIQRHFSAHFLQGEWEPLIETSNPQVCCSSWKLGESTLYTAVNTGGSTSSADWLGSLGGQVFDLITGENAKGAPAIGPHRIAALLSVPDHLVDSKLRSFLTGRRGAAAHRVAANRERSVHSKPSSKSAIRTASLAGMRQVAAGTYELTSHFRARECGEREYAHYQNQVYPELHMDVKEIHRLVTGSFAISARDVSNREFSEFLRDTGYKPKISEMFLHHWSEKHEEDDAVVFISLEDAQAYAEWKGGRLPTDLEWQVAMQELNLDRGKVAVWNWTAPGFTDGQTRFALLKGGADYEAKGSIWYADGGRKGPGFIAKFIQIWPGLDRCRTIGFRWVVDLH